MTPHQETILSLIREAFTGPITGIVTERDWEWIEPDVITMIEQDYDPINIIATIDKTLAMKEHNV